ncbi:MAG TPA: VacJ family lipoprotein [Pseudomonadales bacterium]|nr:VacJ family lipoprotein [Pseudomonadales bacterium]
MSRPWTIAAVALLFACRGVAAADDAPNPDPWEGFNRKIYAFNDFADRYFMKPVAKGYQAATPPPVKRGITSFFSNLSYPLVALNQLLQGRFRLSASDAGRFIVNTTLGVGGLFDPASKAGLPSHDEDFGVTFAKWGMHSGPYLVLPFLGPSTVRDGVGSAVNFFAQPVRYLIDDETTRYGLTALNFIQIRAGLLDTEQLLGGDRYVFLRDAYLQRRDYLIHDGQVKDDFGDEDDSGQEGQQEGPQDGQEQGHE